MTQSKILLWQSSGTMTQSKILLCQSSGTTSVMIQLLWHKSGLDWQTSWTVWHVIELVWQSKKLVWQKSGIVFHVIPLLWLSKILVWHASGIVCGDRARLADARGTSWQAVRVVRLARDVVAERTGLVLLPGELVSNAGNRRWVALPRCNRRPDRGWVVGSHGYEGVDRILGTTAAKVVNHADRSVLVVR